jgi:hypothetical protein
VRVPAAPESLTALRQGARVTLRFLVPRNNIDGNSPGDVARVDVFAMDGIAPITADDVTRRGVRIGTVRVNPPPDPDEVGDEQALADPKAIKDNDQGATARADDTLTSEMLSREGTRSYVAVGFSKRGRSGTLSPRVAVPLGPSPEPPPAPRITYDETAITIRWTSPEPSHIYLQGDPDVRLSDAALSEPVFEDHEVIFGTERCYQVRVVAMREGLPVESDPSPAACVRPVDTFAPKVPVGLQAIASEGAVNLIWEASLERDLAGYMVLRAIAPSTDLTRITESPIPTPTFSDTVPSGSQVTYAVEAVDKAGNVSAASARVTETAR